jgi:uncharacterized protein (TIGR00255 family)
MPVYSMTGYASAQLAPSDADAEGRKRGLAARRIGLEIRSVNSRFLDLALRLPEEARDCEAALRELLGRKLKRGKVELRLFMAAPGANTIAEPPVWMIQRLNAIQDQVLAWLPQARALSVADVMRLCASESAWDPQLAQHVLPLGQQVLDALLAARAREGERLAQAMRERVATLRQLAQQAAPLAPLLVGQQRARFLERWNEAVSLAPGQAAPDAVQDRALAEATAYAIRIDIAEELTRLNAHLDEVDRLLSKGGEIGKRMEFLIQELQREANTLGSKSGSLELTGIAVDMKVSIEQLREQVQNVE